MSDIVPVLLANHLHEGAALVQIQLVSPPTSTQYPAQCLHSQYDGAPQQPSAGADRTSTDQTSAVTSDTPNMPQRTAPMLTCRCRAYQAPGDAYTSSITHNQMESLNVWQEDGLTLPSGSSWWQVLKLRA